MHTQAFLPERIRGIAANAHQHQLAGIKTIAGITFGAREVLGAQQYLPQGFIVAKIGK